MTLPEIWRQSCQLPPTERVLFNQLFSELEHAKQKLAETNAQNVAAPSANYELNFENSSSKYYQPRWFTHGRIQ